MVRLNVQIVNDDGAVVKEAQIEGKTAYFMLLQDYVMTDKQITQKSTAGVFGHPISDQIFIPCLENGIIKIVKDQCNDNNTKVAYQLFNLAENFNKKSDELIEMERKSGKSNFQIIMESLK